MIATVDSFIKIFRFYQENAINQYFLDRGQGSEEKKPDGVYDREHGAKVIDPITKKYKRITLNEIFKINTLRYEDTVDVYLNSLTLDKYTQLSYDNDSETIHTALAARDKLQRYFSNVLYPGSYAFNTVDNSSFRKMLLDWTSTIKTIQDSSKRLTDAYSLSSEDVDKALRGFGTSFINGQSLRSINRRKNFLLNVCDLYSIKGTPQSIIKSLNIIGLNDIFIREGWMFKDFSDGDIKIDWIPVGNESEFNEVTHQYDQLINDDSFITDWNWFDKKISESSQHYDPHWMYSKQDILDINDDADVYLKLPSITPYFGIEFITDADKQIDAMEALFYEINKQFQKYLTNNEKDSDYKLWLNEYDSKLSILQAYTGLVYSLIRFDDHLQYQNFKSFLNSCEIQNLPDFTGTYEYFQIIYWFYLNYKLSDDTYKQNQFDCIYSFIPIKSQNYCNYEQLLRWWLSTDYKQEESTKIKPLYIYPNKLDDSPGYINLGWTAPFDYGRFSVQAFSKQRQTETSDGWLEISSGNYSYQNNMNIIVSSDEADGLGEDVENFRIVYYHTPSNLPYLFFEAPFNLDNQIKDTFLDRTVRYNGAILGISYYNDNLIKNAFEHQHTSETSTNFDVISGYHRNETMSTDIRVTDIDTTLTSMYSSYLKYPNLTRLYEDKWLNINNDFYNYVDWSIKDFTDTKRHEGLLTNNRNFVSDDKTIYRKYPVNSRWNWAVDSNYIYFCYEANRWCRIPCTIIDANTFNLSTSFNYGDKFVVGDHLYIYVSSNKLAKINCTSTWDPNDYDILPCCKTINPKTGSYYWEGGTLKENSKLSRDLAVAQIKDSYILSLIYKDCTITNKDSQYEENNKILKTEEIEVYKNPYTKSKGETYSYETFLAYLYNSRLILDFTTGYIYPNYKAVKCNRDIFFKCYTENTSDTYNKIWVKVEPEYEWTDTKKDGVTAQTIYNDWETKKNELGEVVVDKDNSSNCGFLLPPYTLPNRYDSLRFLDGPAFTSYEDLEEENKQDNIDSSINYVLIRDKENPVVYRRIRTVNDFYTGYLSKWERCLDNHIYDCNYGIGPDLLEFIESRYAQDDQYYVSMINDFTEIINDYMLEELGIDNTILDITIANWTSSGIVKKTIDFYKPKRSRLLFISNIVEGDYGIGNNLDSLRISDHDFNYYDLSQYRYGNPQFDPKNLNRMNRIKISHAINEYVPYNDTIVPLAESENQVYSSREVYDINSKIPSLEVYDQMVNLDQQTNNGITASFYASGFGIYNSDGVLTDNRANGFYYKVPGENIYTNNSYFFQQVSFMYSYTDEYKKVRIVVEDRWALFKTDQTEFNHSTCYFVANKKSNEPYRNSSPTDTTTIKYAVRDFINHPKYIEDLVYDKGEFISQGTVKTNKRILEPVFYISKFTDGHCNGFYYQDDTLHPPRNDKPVYFNNLGKIISFASPDWVIPVSYNKDIYDLDDNWRMTSSTEFYNNITLLETTIDKINGYGHYDVNGKIVFFLWWDSTNEKWNLKDFTHNVVVSTQGADKKIAEYDFTIIDSNVHIERYQRTNKFWIITDDKEIIDYSEAEYFAYCYLNDETIWNIRNNDITKVFHSSFDTTKDIITWGINVAVLYDNEDLIDPINGYIKVINDKYSPYRRNHFNTIEMKNKPISYLYCYNNNIRNFYNDDNRIKIETNSKYYSMDKEGNPCGALEVHSNDNTYLRYINQALNNRNDWTISFRALCYDQESIDKLIGYQSSLVKPNEWFMITMTSNIDYDYYFKFAFDKLKEDSYEILDTFIKNPENSIIKQILQLKAISTDLIFEYASQMSNSVYYDDNGYYYRIEDHFKDISTYYEESLAKYNEDVLISIRDSLVIELQSDIDTIDKVAMTFINDTALHASLRYSEVITTSKSLNNDYNTFYINGKLIKNELNSKDFFSGLTKEKLELKNVNAKVSEYALWEYPINEWYSGVITKFRILRSRPEPMKSKTSRSSNNYRPLFAIEQPRIVYPLEQPALPENTKGGRFDRYNADPANKGDVYTTEENPWWRHESPYYENEMFFVKDGAECNYPRHTVNIGNTLISSSDYKIDTDSIPYWWIRKPESYRSGPINHKPVYISVQEKVDECYPHVNHGMDDKPSNYFDTDINLDGINNSDTSFYDGENIDTITNKDKTYFDIRFDPNSSYTSEYEMYVLNEYNSGRIVGYAKNKDIVIDRDDEKTSIYEIAKNFFPIDGGNKVHGLKLRFIDIDNNGCTFDPSKITNTSIIVPDIAQLTLSEKYMNNGIFHNNVKFYTTNSDYVILIGTYTATDIVQSFKEGDFECCYKNSNGIEAVLTYQRASGYFWWEFRQKNSSNQWNTIARTYVHTKHNISKTMTWKDYVNWNQIDLVGQQVCKFNESDYQDFANKDWHLVNQTIIENKRRFACGSWIKFQLDEVTDPRYIDSISSRSTYFDGQYLYFFDDVSYKWYRTSNKCQTEWNDNIFDSNDLDSTSIQTLNGNSEYSYRTTNVLISDSNGILGKPSTPSGFLYKNNYLYYYVDIDNRWIRFEVTNFVNDEKWSNHYQPWQFYKSKSTMFGYMNVIDSTDCDCFDNSYVIPNNIDIRETYAKLIEFNGVCDFDWSKHMNEDMHYLKSVNNDISICRCSVKDAVYVYVYQINDDNTKTLLDKFEASIIRTDKELVKPDQSPVPTGITDPDVKGYRSMWNFFEFPLYGKYGNNHVNGSVWQNTSSDM